MPAQVRHFDQTGGVVINEQNWADAIAGAVQVAEKFAVENNGDRDLINLVLKILAVTGNDGSTQLRIAADTSGTISPPFEVVVALTGPGAGGIWSGTGVRSWVITAFNATGETIRSFEVSANIDDTTKKATIDWTQVVGATGYKVFRTIVPGVYTSPSLRATIGSGATVQFVDDGTAVGAGAPPVDNTTGGPSPTYGSPPTLGIANVPLAATFRIGEQFFYWVNRVVPAGTAEAGNPRLAQLKFEET